MKISSLLLLLLALILLPACQTQRTVMIKADGQTRLVSVIRAETVGDALQEAGLILGEKDRVSPDIYARLPRSATITVVRITERTESERLPIPFQQEILRDEATAKGETRLIQAGLAGERQRSYRITYEDGLEVRRDFLEERIIKSPVNEVTLVGTRGSLAAVPISGTLAYLSGGNAWIMRSTSANKRPLTFSGDLDQRVFSLSANGRRLVVSRQVAAGQGLDTLWSLDTTILGESPQALDLADILYAEWQQEGLIYSTGQATSGPPGWKANNDLWLLPALGQPRRSLPSPAPGGLYSWWGRGYSLSPNGRSLAYAAPDAVGVMELATGERRVLAQFPVLHTYSDWVWTPGLAWSPDGRHLAAVLHGPPVAGEAPEDSPVFDLWLLPVDGAAGERLVANVGAWALPAWSPVGDRLAYGVAQEPRNSPQSRYDLWIMSLGDRQARKLLPEPVWSGLLPQRVAWSPRGDQLVAVYLGDLYLLGLAGEAPRALTDDGRSGLPQWR